MNGVIADKPKKKIRVIKHKEMTIKRKTKPRVRLKSKSVKPKVERYFLLFIPFPD